MEEERRAVIERKRNILMLISQYLKDNGLFHTNVLLEKEAQFLSNNKEYQICDNVDLDNIYLEYISYYNLKFGKNPKIVKKCDNNANPNPTKKTSSCLERQNSTQKKVDEKKPKSEENNLSASLTVLPMGPMGDRQIDNKTNAEIFVVRRLSDCDYYQNNDWREMAENISRDMLRSDTSTWNRIVGHSMAQNILIESTILPLQYPELFASVGNGWKCTLLHGPPGTGKSALAKALCSETKGKFNFFNVSSSTIISKWRGESEKYIRVLFDVAKFYAPSIILIEEIDGLTSFRDVHEHEATKRFKNEFLAQIDGLYDKPANICILGTTNLPWDIDPAFLRRFEQKLLIGLPDNNERIKLINIFLPLTQEWSKDTLTKLSSMTNGLTGDEIRIACKEASMQKIRQAIAWNKLNSGRNQNPHYHLEQISELDLEKIFSLMKPTSNIILEKHVQWSKKYSN